ncbi:hypothetical protein FHX77_000525 [Bifidobacterium commune]|uniref:Uncharacterized protein n=1 Tax=Bifidobacterium commune TaxID=1505727 RepID=A0A1C4H435_9BIFI|nr:hypothetical protein [Bifidobacterium commune]MBB2955145.1 hypothetical protein [Bifidobacterium commune]SCC79696.1 hypothetical protein GA0061077_0784 [Bifidobacterium commune]
MPTNVPTNTGTPQGDIPSRAYCMASSAKTALRPTPAKKYIQHDLPYRSADDRAAGNAKPAKSPVFFTTFRHDNSARLNQKNRCEHCPANNDNGQSMLLRTTFPCKIINVFLLSESQRPAAVGLVAAYLDSASRMCLVT